MKALLSILVVFFLSIPFQVAAESGDVECNVLNAQQSCVAMEHFHQDNSSIVTYVGQRIEGDRLCIWSIRMRASDGELFGIRTRCRQVQ